MRNAELWCYWLRMTPTPAIGGSGEVKALSRCRYIKLTWLQKISTKIMHQMALQHYARLHPSHSITPLSSLLHPGTLSISTQLECDAVSGRVCHAVGLGSNAGASVTLA